MTAALYRRELLGRSGARSRRQPTTSGQYTCVPVKRISTSVANHPDPLIAKKQ